jgi:hypothetical protein
MSAKLNLPVGKCKYVYSQISAIRRILSDSGLSWLSVSLYQKLFTVFGDQVFLNISDIGTNFICPV